MNKTSHACIETIRDLCDKAQYTEALAVSRKFDIRRTRERNVRSEYHYFVARSLYFLGDYSSALAHVRSALRYSRYSSAHNMYAMQKHLLGAIRHALGDLDEAIEQYSEAYAAAKRAGVFSSLSAVFTNIGLIHMIKGQLSKAEESFERSYELALSYNTDVERCITQLNLSRCYWLQGNLKAVEQCLVRIDSAGHNLDSESKCTQIRGIVSAFRLDSTSSRSLLSSACIGFKAQKSSRYTAVCLEYLGLNEYFAGNYEQARDYYNQVLAMPEPTASAVAQTLRMLTDVEVAEGNWDKAEATAGKAEAAIMKISEKIELGALWRAYGEIYTHKQDSAKAREFFEKSIELLKALGARYELALSHLIAGQSASFTQEQRVEQLQAAKTLFIDMEVPKRIEQVDMLISRLNAGSKSRVTIKSPSQESHSLIAESEIMRKIRDQADQIKDTDMAILITGETGTGKDLLAEYIHYTSLKKDQPFVAVNSANFQESLLESELFGHAKGSFTSSLKDKPGLIETAQGGTFVFDEIGELPLHMQARLLRVVATKTIRRIGETKDRRLDVRFVALTNRNLEQMVADKVFRSDLYYRLNEVHLHLPPLRQRPEDLEAILKHLLVEKDLKVSPEELKAALKAVKGYHWPGNVRQLQKLVKQVSLSVLSSSVTEALSTALSHMRNDGSAVSTDVETLHRHGGNVSRAAKELGIAESTLRYRLRKTD